MTTSEKYTEGQWYGWNGGECPVHTETVVDIVAGTEKYPVNLFESRFAGDFVWSRDDAGPIIAFRVVKHHVEPRVLWVNEYDNDDWYVHHTKEDAIQYAGGRPTRIAVRYVETPE